MDRRSLHLLLAVSLVSLVAAAPDPRVILTGKDGRLTYKTDDRGDRVPDFSHAGYRGGGVPIPDAPARVLVTPTPGDNTARIQAAIDYVSSLPPDGNGIRGAVLLTNGRYPIASHLKITTSGVILRGQGSGDDGTAL